MSQPVDTIQENTWVIYMKNPLKKSGMGRIMYVLER